MTKPTSSETHDREKTAAERWTEIISVRHEPLPCGDVEKLAEWIDAQLARLEAEFSGFVTRSSLKSSLGRRR